MHAIAPHTRGRIEAQGFLGLSDTTLVGINLGLRVAPTLCMLWTATGTALASHVVLWALVPFAALGAVLRGHPFDVLYNHGLRYIKRTPALPPYAMPRRFTCAMATVWLAAAAWSFQSGATLSGQLLGYAFVAVAFVTVTTGFCIPSFVFGLLFGKSTRADARTQTSK
jgi:hypothetical protein